jgi:hypothetical protein
MSKPLTVLDDPDVAARRRWLAAGAALAIAGLSTGCATRPTIAPASASPAEPTDWEAFQIPGKRPTHYSRVQWLGLPAWHAKADRSASMWRRRVHRQPDRIGEVEFSWWVPALIETADLAQADSSDSPARVIFAFDGDRSRLSARNKAMFELASLLTGETPPYATLMYVWDRHAAPEKVIQSGRTDRIRKIVVESGTGHLRQWRTYRRDLRRDFARAYGEPPGALVAVGLMTDADNTGAQAEAWYGDIRLI